MTLTEPLVSDHRSAVRTPVIQAGAPATPLPNADVRVPEVQTLSQCKREEDLHALCEEASKEFGLFGDQISDRGLIEIDSSSGSDSDSDSSSSDDSSSGHFQNALPAPMYTEYIPEDQWYFVHKKSKIMHKAKAGADVSACKTSFSSNFFEAPRVLHFKYPKCMKCFVSDHNRIRSLEETVEQLEKASKRRKGQAH